MNLCKKALTTALNKIELLTTLHTAAVQQAHEALDESERLRSQIEDLALALKCAYMDEGCSEHEAIRTVVAIIIKPQEKDEDENEEVPNNL